MAQAVTPERIAEARRYVANAEEHARHWRAEVQVGRAGKVERTDQFPTFAGARRYFHGEAGKRGAGARCPGAAGARFNGSGPQVRGAGMGCDRSSLL